jgi:hypothetical protein
MNASYLALGLLLAAADPVTTEADLPIHPEAARVFPAQVQPVLMNLCARCHCRPDHPGGFKLARVADGYSNEQATSRNLRAAAVFVRADQPALSPLLVKAVSPHGGMKDPPLHSRGHPAFRNLDQWASRALIPTAAPSKPTTIVQAGATVPAEPAAPAPLPPAETKPAAKPNANDPFDPAVFNQSVPVTQPVGRR